MKVEMRMSYRGDEITFTTEFPGGLKEGWVVEDVVRAAVRGRALIRASIIEEIKREVK
jgi:hypothetical protein